MQVKPRFLNTRAGDSDDESNISPFRSSAPIRNATAARYETAADESGAVRDSPNGAALSSSGAASKPGIFGYLYERKTTVCIVAIVVIIVIILGYILYQHSSADVTCAAVRGGARKAPRTRPGGGGESQQPVGRAVPQRLKDMAKAAQAAASGAANALAGGNSSNATETPQLTAGEQSAPESGGDSGAEPAPGSAEPEEEEEGENEPAELQEDDSADEMTAAQD